MVIVLVTSQSASELEARHTLEGHGILIVDLLRAKFIDADCLKLAPNKDVNVFFKTPPQAASGGRKEAFVNQLKALVMSSSISIRNYQLY